MNSYFPSSARSPFTFTDNSFDSSEDSLLPSEYLEDTILHLEVAAPDHLQYLNDFYSRTRPSHLLRYGYKIEFLNDELTSPVESDTQEEEVVIEDVAEQEIVSDPLEEHFFNETTDTFNEITQPKSKSKKTSSISKPLYECHKCKSKFRRKKSLITHILSHKLSINCVRSMDEVSVDTSHDFEFHGDSSLTSSITKLPDSASNIKKREHNQFICSYCGKRCKDYRGLQKHSSVHSDGHFLCCYTCGKQFYSRTRLRRHMLSHRDKQVSCEICDFKVADYRALAHHRSNHHVVNRNGSPTAKIFPCHICEKIFSSRSSQQIHMRVHTGERPYSCRFCVKAFADGGTLRKHERIHTGEKPYVCPICSKAFNQRVVLREHIRVHHTSASSITCEVCSHVCSTSQELCSHLVKHSDDNTARSRKPSEKPRTYRKRKKSENVMNKRIIDTRNAYTFSDEDVFSTLPVEYKIDPQGSEIFENIQDNVFETSDNLLPFVDETETKNWAAVVSENNDCKAFNFEADNHQLLNSFNEKLPEYCKTIELHSEF